MATIDTSQFVKDWGAEGSQWTGAQVQKFIKDSLLSIINECSSQDDLLTQLTAKNSNNTIEIAGINEKIAGQLAQISALSAQNNLLQQQITSLNSTLTTMPSLLLCGILTVDEDNSDNKFDGHMDSVIKVQSINKQSDNVNVVIAPVESNKIKILGVFAVSENGTTEVKSVGSTPVIDNTISIGIATSGFEEASKFQIIVCGKVVSGGFVGM